MSAISANLASPPNAFSTTLSSGIASNALTIPLNSVTGLASEGVGVLFTKNANGGVVAGSVEIIHWTGVASLSLTLTDTGDRGLTGSDAGAQAYSASVTFFEVWVTSYYYKSLLDGIASVVVPVKATAAEVNTGTNDAKFLTPKALKDSSLTSGWQSVADTWTYASADAPTFTITVPTGAASIYGVGDRIQLTQTTAKYFIITVVADTVLTVYGGTDYVLANATISAISYSHNKSPLGFPLDPTKWSVKTTDATSRTQAAPVLGTWYNLGAVSISIPIGVWLVDYQVSAGYREAASTAFGVQVTLSTANNSESDSEFSSGSNGLGTSISSMFGKSKILVIAAKTPYYLNTRTADSGVDNIDNVNDSRKLVLRAICAFL